MNVLIASFDAPNFPCARLRLLDPLALAPDVSVRWGVEEDVGGARFRMDHIAWADIIVTQRSLPRPDTQPLLDALHASGKPLVYETDDCLPEVPDFLGKPHYRKWGPAILQWAKRVDAITVPTQPLADYFAPHARRIVVLPNYLTSRTRPSDLASRREPGSGRIEVGYAGNPGHRGDLALVAGSLARLLARRAEVRITFFGAMPDGFTASDRVRIVPADFDYETFPSRLAELGFDFGLAPLVDHPFNRCVSNLKYLEYGALGIPGIFSRAPAYDTVRHGDTGLLCDDAAEAWDAALDALCADAALRERLGRAARDDVRGRWMLEPNARRWQQLYESLSVRAPRRPPG